jgi:hypothetical protein
MVAVPPSAGSVPALEAIDTSQRTGDGDTDVTDEEPHATASVAVTTAATAASHARER